MTGYSQRFEEALVLAATAHRTQLRKGTDIPYMTHPVHVAFILARYGYAEEVVIAGLLHDVIEDCGVLAEDLAQRFGVEVAELVVALSERKRDAQGELPWEERKAAQLALLEAAPAAAIAVKAADTLHNLRTIHAALQEQGAAVWGRFKRGREQSLASHERVVRLVEQRLAAHPLALELRQAFDLLQAPTDAL